MLSGTLPWERFEFDDRDSRESPRLELCKFEDGMFELIDKFDRGMVELREVFEEWKLCSCSGVLELFSCQTFEYCRFWSEGMLEYVLFECASEEPTGKVAELEMECV